MKRLPFKKKFFFFFGHSKYGVYLHHSFTSLEMDTIYFSLLECLSLEMGKGSVLGLYLVLPLRVLNQSILLKLGI